MTITCARCNSPDWVRCDPGDLPVTGSEDEAQDCAAVAYCRVCDPLVRRAA